MGLEKVVVEIKENAERKAEGMVREAEKEAERIIREAKERAKQAKKGIEKENEQAIRQIEMRNLTIRKARKKELVLKAKKEMMDEVYMRFLVNISKSKGRKRETIYRKLASIAKKQMKRPGVVYMDPKDSGLSKKVWKGLRFRKKEMKGGFMLESDDGKEFVDFRFETLNGLLKEKTLKDVSRMLFGG